MNLSLCCICCSHIKQAESRDWIQCTGFQKKTICKVPVVCYCVLDRRGYRTWNIRCRDWKNGKLKISNLSHPSSDAFNGRQTSSQLRSLVSDVRIIDMTSIVRDLKNLGVLWNSVRTKVLDLTQPNCCDKLIK